MRAIELSSIARFSSIYKANSKTIENAAGNFLLK